MIVPIHVHEINTAPFFFPGDGRRAALLIHGFTGTPYEMRGLGEALAAEGIAARGIRLPGHDSSDSMTGVLRAQWREAVREAFYELRRTHERVAVVGLSMGGLLSLDIASDPGVQVDAVVSLAAPMFLYGWQAKYLLPFVASSPLKTAWKWRKRHRGNIRDTHARERHPSLMWCTVDAIGELRLLLHEVRARLGAVTAPILIIHGQHDGTALVQSADILYRRVGSHHKEKIILPESAHIVTVDLERKQVEREVTRFLLRRLALS
jgi:carboxylesterase